MTCRVARSFQYDTQTEPVYCCECGSTHLETFFALKTLGPHLCPICARSKVECGVAESMARSPMREQPVA
jgi:hypothetical protein